MDDAKIGAEARKYLLRKQLMSVSTTNKVQEYWEIVRAAGYRVVDGGQVSGEYCTWRLLDRAATLGSEGQVTWDLEAASVLLKEGVRNYASVVVGAGPAKKLVEEYGVAPAPSENLLGVLRVEKDSTTGAITMRQSYEVPYEMKTTVVFTPTKERTVDRVAEDRR